MKAKYLLLLAALTFSFIACEKQEPFDTQSPSDEPLILIPYWSDQTGSVINAEVTNPNPYVDSVVVVPSAYTTVNWYLDSVKVHTGTKINQAFPSGSYKLLVEAVTTEGKRTYRAGTLNVKPANTDPYVTTRVMAPEIPTTMEGRNLGQVAKIVLSKDLFGKDTVCTIVPTNIDANKMDVTLPELPKGTYYINLFVDDTTYFGSDKLQVLTDPMVLTGVISFAPGDEWTMTGVNLKKIASITIGTTVITEFTATANSITLTAPNMEAGTYTMTMQSKDGSAVLFSTLSGNVSEVQIRVRSAEEKRLWVGPVALDWNADLVNITEAQMTGVPVGSTILVYFDMPAAEYHQMRITTPWWGDDLVAQFGPDENTPNPFTFVYDDRCKGIVEMVHSWSIVGFGETIYEITYK